MSRPCAHFWTLPTTRCSIGSDSAHGSGLHAPRDCSENCSGYVQEYQNQVTSDDIEELERAMAWHYAVEGK